MSHLDPDILQEALIKAEKLVQIGNLYSHYKNPLNLYKVIALGIQEATDKVCVIYQAENDKGLIFVRDLDNWLENILVEGKNIKRFKLVTKK